MRSRLRALKPIGTPTKVVALPGLPALLRAQQQAQLVRASSPATLAPSGMTASSIFPWVIGLAALGTLLLALQPTKRRNPRRRRFR